jgi:hypothetical protein
MLLPARLKAVPSEEERCTPITGRLIEVDGCVKWRVVTRSVWATLLRSNTLTTKLLVLLLLTIAKKQYQSADGLEQEAVHELGL